VIHPFHPLFGREIVLAELRHLWSEARAYFHDDRGELTSIPVAWTDLAAPDPFVVAAAGRAPSRLLDLVELGRLARAIRARQAEP
jgi:hypothetical protein